MTRHKFCIAIENNVGKDYVTEKVPSYLMIMINQPLKFQLWDCLRAGAVPIYFGAPNAETYLPGGKKSAIFIRDFETIEELAAFMKKVD